MTLKITRLTVRDFRCYEEYRLEPAEDLTILVGPNATGKTNLVEAIQLLTAGESFRRPQWSEVVRWGADKGFSAIEAEGEGRELTVELAIEGGRREYRVNGKIKRRMADVVGVLPSVVFVPDDLKLTKESADKRRAALDSLGSQISPSYLALKSEYERVLRQRNKVLKDEDASRPELEVWTERLVATGSRLQDARKRLFARLVGPLLRSHEELTGDARLAATYRTASERDGVAHQEDSEKDMLAHLSAKNREEILRGTTLVGPHRDDVEFTIGGREARAYASQGQHRSIALAWKLSEVSVISDTIGQTPVLLLDDVMSELDETRRHALAEKAGTTAQTIITTTNTGYFDRALIERAKVVSLG